MITSNTGVIHTPIIMDISIRILNFCLDNEATEEVWNFFGGADPLRVLPGVIH